MYNPHRNLLVLVRHEIMSDCEWNRELANLNAILQLTDSLQVFCYTHELACRNRITTRFKKILKAAAKPDLKAFHFLIGKN
ncbi:MAG: hypothetical protein JST10_12515 [Bacteroidetes bacterium]|nr:hypothetical protein [Bacteroidota bacterium]MBS1633383.1 hypothetical protein [Bacteroidota bacterium]